MFGNIERHAYRLTRPLVLLPTKQLVRAVRRGGYPVHCHARDRWYVTDPEITQRGSGAAEAIAAVYPAMIWTVSFVCAAAVTALSAGVGHTAGLYVAGTLMLGCAVVTLGSLHSLSERPIRVNPPEEVRHDA